MIKRSALLWITLCMICVVSLSGVLDMVLSMESDLYFHLDKNKMMKCFIEEMAQDTVVVTHYKVHDYSKKLPYLHESDKDQQQQQQAKKMKKIHKNDIVFVIADSVTSSIDAVKYIGSNDYVNMDDIGDPEHLFFVDSIKESGKHAYIAKQNKQFFICIDASNIDWNKIGNDDENIRIHVKIEIKGKDPLDTGNGEGDIAKREHISSLEKELSLLESKVDLILKDLELSRVSSIL